MPQADCEYQSVREYEAMILAHPSKQDCTLEDNQGEEALEAKKLAKIAVENLCEQES